MDREKRNDMSKRKHLWESPPTLTPLNISVDIVKIIVEKHDLCILLIARSHNQITVLTFLKFLHHLLVQDPHYFSHPVFSILCHVFSQLVFLHVSFYVVPPYFSVDLCSFSQKLVLAISHRCEPNIVFALPFILTTYQQVMAV